MLIAPLIILFLVAAPAGSQDVSSNSPSEAVQHIVLASDIAWQPCAAHLPAGCEIAVLEGNPGGSGLFTVRFRLSDAFVMPPHTHPKDERVTVLNGRVSVAFIVDGSQKDAKQFAAGDYYVNRHGAVHTVWADEQVELQITGIGPWEAHFVEQDDP
jgi:quercetin dioxygenase-like cupin family protein